MKQLVQRLKKADSFVYGFVLVMTFLIILASLLASLIVLFISIEKLAVLFLLFIITPLVAFLACLGLWSYYIFTGYFYMSACYKGFSDRMYLRYCFFFGVPGWLLICSLPTMAGKKSDFFETEDDEDDDHSGSYAENNSYTSGDSVFQSVKKIANNILTGNLDDNKYSESTPEKNRQTNNTTPLYAPEPYPQAIVTDDNGHNHCPCCDAEVSLAANKCPVCGHVFSNSITTVPYWCKECGQEGPYPGPCPKCRNTVKVRNPFYVR